MTPAAYQSLTLKFAQRAPWLSLGLFLIALTLFTVWVPLANNSFGGGGGPLPDTMVQLFGKILCFALLAIALDLVWGYCGILSLGHGAFFALGGYAIAMNVIYATTDAKMQQIADPVARDDAVRQSIFSVVGQGDQAWPWFWAFADIFWVQALFVIVVPGAVAFLFGWFAFRSRVTGVYLSIITQAMTLTLGYLFIMNEFGLRGNNGLSGLQNVLGFSTTETSVKAGLFIASAVALALGYILVFWLTRSKLGNVIRGIRDDEDRVRFLGYNVEGYKLFVFVISAVLAGIAGALFAPQAGIINPSEFGPLKSIEVAIWVALGGRGYIYGAVIGAFVVNFLRSALTGGWINALSLFGLSVDLSWVPWPEIWPLILGVLFVVVTLFMPRGIVGLWHDIMALLWRRAVVPWLVRPETAAEKPPPAEAAHAQR